MHPVNMLHKPVDMQEMVSCIKPRIKYKQIDENLFEHLK